MRPKVKGGDGGSQTTRVQLKRFQTPQPQQTPLRKKSRNYKSQRKKSSSKKKHKKHYKREEEHSLSSDISMDLEKQNKNLEKFQQLSQEGTRFLDIEEKEKEDDLIHNIFKTKNNFIMQVRIFKQLKQRVRDNQIERKAKQKFRN